MRPGTAVETAADAAVAGTANLASRTIPALRTGQRRRFSLTLRCKVPLLNPRRQPLSQGRLLFPGCRGVVFFAVAFEVTTTRNRRATTRGSRSASTPNLSTKPFGCSGLSFSGAVAVTVDRSGGGGCSTAGHRAMNARARGRRRGGRRRHLREVADVASGLQQTVDEDLLLARDREKAVPEELLELSNLSCHVIQSSSVGITRVCANRER